MGFNSGFKELKGNFNHWQVSRKEAGQIFFSYITPVHQSTVEPIWRTKNLSIEYFLAHFFPYSVLIITTTHFLKLGLYELISRYDVDK